MGLNECLERAPQALTRGDSVASLKLHADRRRAGVPTLSVLRGPLPAAIEQFRTWAAESGLSMAVAHLGEGCDWVTEWSAVFGTDLALRERAVALVAHAAGTSPESVRWLLDSHARDAVLLFERAASASRTAAVACAVLGRGAMPSMDAERALLDLLQSIGSPPALLVVVEEYSASAATELQRLVQVLENAPIVTAAMALPPEACTGFVGGADFRWKALLREGVVEVEASLPGPVPPLEAKALSERTSLVDAGASDALVRAFDAAATLDAVNRAQGTARSAYEALLFKALDHHPETAGQFELNGKLEFNFGPRPAEVDIVSRRLGIAIEIDGFFHFAGGEEAWRRDRRKDVLLQQHDYLVMRWLATDVVERLSEVVASVRALVRQRRRTSKEK